MWVSLDLRGRNRDNNTERTIEVGFDVAVISNKSSRLICLSHGYNMRWANEMSLGWGNIALGYIKKALTSVQRTV